MGNITYDQTALKVKQDFSLSLDIDDLYPVKNTDGSNATFIVSVEAPNVGEGLKVLKLLGKDEGQQILRLLIDHARIEGNFDPTISYQNILKEPKFNTIFTTTKEWISVPITARVTEVGGGETFITLTSPSYMIAYEAFCALTTEQRINNLMSSFMPTEWWAEQVY